MVKFAGLEFELLSKNDLFLDRNKTLFVVTANAEIIVKANEEKDYKSILAKASCTFDGQVPFFLARLKNPGVTIEKISGSDLVYDVCNEANKKKRKIFLLGGQIDSNALSQRKIKELYPEVEVSGFSPEFSPYPFAPEFNQKICKKIEEFSPDYLFVGFGAGKQEFWINDNLTFIERNKIKMVVGSGGTFEFVSGKIKRAPKIIQKIGLEGIFRLIVEPKFFRVKRIIKSLKIFYYAIFPKH